MTNALPGTIAENIRAINAFDTDAIVATFAADAYVNDKSPHAFSPRHAPYSHPAGSSGSLRSCAGACLSTRTI